MRHDSSEHRALVMRIEKNERSIKIRCTSEIFCSQKDVKRLTTNKINISVDKIFKIGWCDYTPANAISLTQFNSSSALESVYDRSPELCGKLAIAVKLRVRSLIDEWLDSLVRASSSRVPQSYGARKKSQPARSHPMNKLNCVHGAPDETTMKRT